jgi:AcrR family transcriptional regulator
MNEDICDKILQTALEQFMHYGIRSMSVQKLVDSLNISTKTVYKHFKNKEELLEEVLRLHYKQQYLIFEKLMDDQKTVTLFYDIWYHAVEREFGVNNAFFRDLHYYYANLERKIEAEIATKFWKKLKQLITNGISEGFFNENIIPEVLLEGIAILSVKIGRSEQFQKFKVSHHDIFRNTIENYIRGFCTGKGLKELDKHIEKRFV